MTCSGPLPQSQATHLTAESCLSTYSTPSLGGVRPSDLCHGANAKEGCRFSERERILAELEALLGAGCVQAYYPPRLPPEYLWSATPPRLSLPVLGWPKFGPYTLPQEAPRCKLWRRGGQNPDLGWPSRGVPIWIDAFFFRFWGGSFVRVLPLVGVLGAARRGSSSTRYALHLGHVRQCAAASTCRSLLGKFTAKLSLGHALLSRDAQALRTRRHVDECRACFELD